MILLRLFWLPQNFIYLPRIFFFPLVWEPMYKGVGYWKKKNLSWCLWLFHSITQYRASHEALLSVGNLLWVSWLNTILGIKWKKRSGIRNWSISAAVIEQHWGIPTVYSFNHRHNAAIWQEIHKMEATTFSFLCLLLKDGGQCSVGQIWRHTKVVYSPPWRPQPLHSNRIIGVHSLPHWDSSFFTLHSKFQRFKKCEEGSVSLPAIIRTA